MRTFRITFVLMAIVGCSSPSSSSKDAPVVRHEKISKQFEILAGSDSDYFFPVFPNPFSRATGDERVTIDFSVSDSARAIVLIQNPIGEEIIRFSDSTLRSGRYTWRWDPIDANGEALASGLYFITVNIRNASEQNQTRPNYIQSRMLQILNN